MKFIISLFLAASVPRASSDEDHLRREDDRNLGRRGFDREWDRSFGKDFGSGFDLDFGGKKGWKGKHKKNPAPCSSLNKCFDLTNGEDCFTSFDGSDPGLGAIDLGGASDPDLEPDEEITVEAWFRNVSGNYILVKGAQDNSSGSYFFYQVTSGLKFGVRAGGDWQEATDAFGGSSSWSSDDTWHHVVGTYDGTDVKLYVDGMFKTTTADPPNGDIDYDLNVSNDLFLGAYPNPLPNGSFFASGDVSRVCIWNEALTEEEVARLYHSYVWPPTCMNECPEPTVYTNNYCDECMDMMD